MKHALKLSLLIVLGAVLLAGLHTHAREHQVLHPDATKVSLSTGTASQPQLPAVLAAIAVLAAEHLIAVDVPYSPGLIPIIECEDSPYHLRGPPVAYPLSPR